MKGFFRRLSDVIAWIGFGLMILAVYNLDDNERFGVGAGVWFGVGVINYLLSGSLRLLPWRKLDE
jgi:hypothetical protein